MTDLCEKNIFNNDSSDDSSDDDMSCVPDDLSISKPEIDSKLIKLQNEVVDFVSTVILKHEIEIYDLVKKNFSGQMAQLLGTTNPKIIEIITTITNKFYNKMYKNFQNKKFDAETMIINSMLPYVNYGPHVLLEKLIKITIDAHIDLVRENLVVDVTSRDVYEKSINVQLNLYFKSNLCHVLSSDKSDSTPFVALPENQDAFDIVIDQNILPIL